MVLFSGIQNEGSLSSQLRRDLEGEVVNPDPSPSTNIEHLRASVGMYPRHTMNSGSSNATNNLALDMTPAVANKITTTNEAIHDESTMSAELIQTRIESRLHDSFGLSSNSLTQPVAAERASVLRHLGSSNAAAVGEEPNPPESEVPDADIITTPRILSTDQEDPLMFHNECELDVRKSLRIWCNKKHSRSLAKFTSPKRPSVVGSSNDGDLQGIGFGTTVPCSREELMDFRTHAHAIQNQVAWNPKWFISKYGRRDGPFRPSRTHRQVVARADHYQLRNLLVSTSSHDAYYSKRGQVFHVDPISPIGSTERPSIIMDLGHLDCGTLYGCRVTTLNTVCNDLLFAGSLTGQYGYINLNSETTTSSPLSTGQLRSWEIINSIDSTYNTSNAPVAALASNDYKRTLTFVDCTRNEVLSTKSYHETLESITNPRQAIINNTTTSPDGRLRICVGDFNAMLLTDARTGGEIEEFPFTYGRSSPTIGSSYTSSSSTGSFACAWSPDGFTVATGSEDKLIRLWDVRTWKTIAEYPSYMASCRNLHFSPLGGGPLTLIAGETNDVVHVIDVRTAQQLQVLHYFGDNVGMAFSPDGAHVLVANADRAYGGLMMWRRKAWGQPFVDEAASEDDMPVYIAERRKKRQSLVGALVPTASLEEECYIC